VLSKNLNHLLFLDNNFFLAGNICCSDLAPEGLNYVYFVSGGTEANETAFSMALQYHIQRAKASKWKIIGRTLSYHGSSLELVKDKEKKESFHKSFAGCRKSQKYMYGRRPDPLYRSRRIG
jgi:adenosylmethionine-8-amino-7-oxononanoate aminotransferase